MFEQNVYRIPQLPLQQPSAHASAVPPPLHLVASVNANVHGNPNASDLVGVPQNMVPIAVNPITVPKSDVGSDRPVSSFIAEARGTGPSDPVSYTHLTLPTNREV